MPDLIFAKPGSSPQTSNVWDSNNSTLTFSLTGIQESELYGVNAADLGSETDAKVVGMICEDLVNATPEDVFSQESIKLYATKQTTSIELVGSTEYEVHTYQINFRIPRSETGLNLNEVAE